MQAIERIQLNDYWLTLVFILVLLLLALLKSINQNKLSSYFKAFFLKGFVQKRTEENESFFSLFNLMLFFLSTIIYTLVIVVIGNKITEFSFSLMLFIKTFGLTLLYLSTFFIVDKALIHLLELQHPLGNIFSAKISYLYNSALLLYPVLIINYYSQISYFLLFSIFVILFILSALLIVLNNKNLIINKLFYFILYLCALEIAPLLIIYKITVKI